MKKIGRGWQYTVYYIGNNRVRKIFNTKKQAFSIFIKECFPYTKFPVWKFSKLRGELMDKAKVSISWVKDTNLDPSLFGNPTILNETDYEQDMVVPLDRHLQEISLDHGKAVTDEFIELNKFFVANNVIDKSFLIGKNYGVNKQGKIILTDIGELFIGKEKIEKQIKLKPWDHSYVTKTLPKKLRSYFIESMNRNFT